MGIFNKLFKKTKQNELSQLIPKHEEQWDFYFSNVDNITGSFNIDLGLTKVAPIKTYNNFIWVSIKMINPRTDGLSSTEESNMLYKIEDRLTDFMNNNHQSIYTGRLTSNGNREFFFYVVNPFLYDKTISDAMVAFLHYEYDFGIKEDIEWNHYFKFQYPSPRQFQSIQNRRVVDQLEKNGDKLIKERRVDHWLFFKIHADREIFLQKISNDGFNITDIDYDMEYGDYPYRLRIYRIDKVDLNNIDDYTLYLWQLAQDCDGEYDGWETSVEKDE